MRLSIALGALCLSLSGCLSKMEGITEQTRDAVKESKEKIEESIALHSVGDAAKIFANTANAEAWRTGAAIKLFQEVNEDKLPTYMAAMGPVRVASFSRTLNGPRAGETTQLDVPNVTLISPTGEGDISLGFVSVDPVTYRCMAVAVRRVIEVLKDVARTPGQAHRMAEGRATIERLLYIGTSVYGASPMRDFTTAYRGGNPRALTADRIFQENVGTRTALCTDLKAVAIQFSVAEGELQRLRDLCEMRMNVILPR